MTRKDPRSNIDLPSPQTNAMDLMDFVDTLISIILNKPVRKFGGLWRSKHSVARRKINSVWYNLDNDLACPLPFENGDEYLKEFLDGSLAHDGEVLMVL